MKATKNKIFLTNPMTNNKEQNKRNVIFQLHQFSIFLAKISGIGPWVSRINWCKMAWTTSMPSLHSTFLGPMSDFCFDFCYLFFKKGIIFVFFNVNHYGFHMRQPLFLHYWLMVSDINSVQEKFQTQQFNFSILQSSIHYSTQFISLISESVERLNLEFFFEFSDRWYNRLRIILWLNSSWWVANRFFHWFPFGCRSRREKWWFFNRKPMIRWWYFTLKGPNQLYQTATLVRTVTTSFLSIIIYGTKIFFW